MNERSDRVLNSSGFFRIVVFLPFHGINSVEDLLVREKIINNNNNERRRRRISIESPNQCVNSLFQTNCLITSTLTLSCTMFISFIYLEAKCDLFKSQEDT